MAEHVRFFVYLLPPSAAPDWLGWPCDPTPWMEHPDPAGPTSPEHRAPGSWYAWRLLSTNNRELARSAFRFAAVEPCRQAVDDLRKATARLVLKTFSYPVTCRYSWQAELDGDPVAAGKRYEHEQNARYAAQRFLDVVAGAQVVDTVRPLVDRRGPAPSRIIVAGRP
ncbi:hypothetical protein ACN27F_17065 [Solwaraspora sp. WMMB335]|uniref:hypothetical protein n=1 Tax=Solwaraspora sp. WMMB335 TaxID=3404118 RepID=UPI003B92C303